MNLEANVIRLKGKLTNDEFNNISEKISTLHTEHEKEVSNLKLKLKKRRRKYKLQVSQLKTEVETWKAKAMSTMVILEKILPDLEDAEAPVFQHSAPIETLSDLDTDEDEYWKI